MRHSPAGLLNKIMPYIGIGIFVVLLIVAFILLSYILLIGAAIGLILFVVAYIKQRFFTKKTQTPAATGKKLSQTFEHDEFR